MGRKFETSILMLAALAGVATAADWPQNCGQSQRQSVRIIGGRDADPGEWPWQALISANGGICGGTLIRENLVLTAAHCVRASGHTLRNDQIQVRLGEHDISVKDGPDDAEQEHIVEKVVIHPEYRPERQWENDIALLKISPRVAKDNQRAVPACLPFNMPELGKGKLDGRMMFVTGWGLKDNGQLATRLQEADIFGIESAQTCDANMDVAFCAGVPDRSKSACNGDSGGPLVTSVNGRHYLVGVVGKTQLACAVGDQPGVYARVTSFLGWLDREASRLS